MKKGVFIFWSIFLGAALMRLYFSFDQAKPILEGCLKKIIQGTGIVMVEPERKESGQIFTVAVNELADPENGFVCGRDLQIRMKADLYPRFQYGDSVVFEGKISAPFNFKSSNGRAFDYEGYLAKDDIYYEIKSATVQVRETLQKNSLASALFTLKRGFVANLEYALGEPHAALAAGLVVGEKSALGSNLLDDFRTVGLIHIVVLSGYNITIVADALRRMLSFLPRFWGIIIGAIGIALFGILVGGGATVVRSCFMAALALSADLIRRTYSVHRALFLAGLIMLIENPNILLHDPSFQLSFLATLGLVVLAKPIEDRLSFVPEKFGIRGIVATTFATQVFVSPYILYMMGDLSIIGLVVNILVLPIIPLTMLFVFLTGAIGFIVPMISTHMGWITHILLSYELFMVEKFAQFPYAKISVPSFSGWIVLLVYSLILAIYFALSKLPWIISQLRLEKKSST